MNTPFHTTFFQAFLALPVLVLIGLSWTPQTLAQANANPPERMTYQGFLADSSGAPLGTNAPRNYDVIFRIMGDQQTGPTLWAEQQTVTVDKGYFSVLLGEGTQITSPLEPHPALSTLFRTNTASERYVEMTVKGIGTGGSNVTILPRLRLLTSPYSFLSQRAISAASLDDGAQITGGVVNDARLSANVALRAGGNSFTGNQTISGNVGIGTVAPVQRLDVRGNINLGHWTENFGSRRIGIMNGDPLQTAGMEIENTTAGGNYSQKLHLLTHRYAGSYGRRLTIDEDGKVGIGTSTPQSILEVAGQIENAQFTSTNDTRIRIGRSGVATGANGIIHWDNTRQQMQFAVSGVSLGGSLNIAQSGRVGIGTVAPRAPLEVTGSSPISPPAYNYLARITNGIGFIPAGRGPYDFSIIAEKKIMAEEFDAVSDRRIKEVVGKSNPQRDLESIIKLKVTDYRMVDKLTQGNRLHKGFIAQEVKQVMPEAVSETRNFIPNIYTPASSCDFDSNGKSLSLVLPKAHELKVGDLVKLFTDESIHELRVTEVTSTNKFVVGHLEKAPKNVFVYGKEVEDFMSITYDRIFTSGISAIQELNRKVEALEQSEARIAELEKAAAKLTDLEVKAARVDSLYRKVAELKKLAGENSSLQEKLEAQAQRLAQLEAKDKARDAKFAAIEQMLRSPDQPGARPVSLLKVSAAE